MPEHDSYFPVSDRTDAYPFELGLPVYLQAQCPYPCLVVQCYWSLTKVPRLRIDRDQVD